MQNEGITSKLKELEQLKLSPSTKCAAADKFTPPQKKLQAVVPNVEITVRK